LVRPSTKALHRKHRTTAPIAPCPRPQPRSAPATPVIRETMRHGRTDRKSTTSDARHRPRQRTRLHSATSISRRMLSASHRADLGAGRPGLHSASQRCRASWPGSGEQAPECRNRKSPTIRQDTRSGLISTATPLRPGPAFALPRVCAAVSMTAFLSADCRGVGAIRSQQRRKRPGRVVLVANGRCTATRGPRLAFPSARYASVGPSLVCPTAVATNLGPARERCIWSATSGTVPSLLGPLRGGSAAARAAALVLLEKGRLP
jgi:hypothetical protein